MKTTVVCGQLGSGKTTFIQNFLRHSDKRTVVLVNDFGKLGIDGEVINSSGMDTIELPSGCVCCTLKFDLITTLQMIKQKYNPEELIIEPSGVAAVSGILEALELAKIDQISVIGIIDTTEFLELYDAGIFGNFFEDQVRHSDIILLNKADLSDQDTIARTAKKIEEINPAALIFTTVKAQIDEPFEIKFGAKRASKDVYNIALKLETISLSLQKSITLEEVLSLLNRLKGGDFGRVLRAKSLLQDSQGGHKIDYAAGRVFVEPFEQRIQNSRIVFIGYSLNRAALLSALKMKNMMLL